MFDRIVSAELPRRAARRGAWSSAAAAVQAALVGGVVGITGGLPAEPAPPVVEVVFAGPIAAPRRADAPPAAPAVLTAGHRAALSRPGVRTVKPPPPSALLQPREIAPEMRMPAADEPIEAIEPGAVLEGEEGVVGGFAAPIAPAAHERAPGGIEEAPQYATAGFRRPAEARPGCVAAAIRLPPELAGFVSGVTVRFAVGRDGAVGRITLLGEFPDPRVQSAIARALQSCRWIPGADLRGQPIAIWVVMPIRFEAG